MAEPLKTMVDGVEVEVPNTIPGIRAALPEERREEFVRAINSAGVHEIHAVMRHWMFEVVPDPAADAFLDRLAHEELEKVAVVRGILRERLGGTLTDADFDSGPDVLSNVQRLAAEKMRGPGGDQPIRP
ncbi:hypothetical protein OG707_14505 [Streptomyces sp. NBC_01465]